MYISFLPPFTVFKVDCIGSTNDTLMNWAKEKKAPHLSVIWAKHQIKGRGASGGSWVSQAGKNLTFSILLYLNKATAHSQELMFSACCALHKALTSLFPEEQFFIKWPNDIVLKRKKIAGILVESKLVKNSLVWAVIGMGVNLQQLDYSGLSQASSLLKLTGRSISPYGLLKVVLGHFYSIYLLENKNSYEILQAYYHQHLYKRGKVCVFLKENTHFNGIIQGVDQQGLLLIMQEDGQLQRYRSKEVSMLY